MHKQRFKIGSSVISWKAGQIIFNDFNSQAYRNSSFFFFEVILISLMQ